MRSFKQHRRFDRFGTVVALIGLCALGLTVHPGACAAQQVRVFAFNDLGMHCYDPEFSIFAILPPYNVLHAQVIRTGREPQILNNRDVRVLYRAQKDPEGSINTTSRRKTNFWAHVRALFGVSLPVDVGLAGARMPGPRNLSRPFKSFDPNHRWFAANGIPITVFEDSRRLRTKNPYPLMNVRALNKNTGRVLATLPVVVPVSDEMACDDCHLTGKRAADDPRIQWSTNRNPVIQYRKNVLLLHDAREGTDLMGSRPVLCASCHYSLALDLEGTGPTGRQNGKPYLSRAIHGSHASHIRQDPTSLRTCSECHPSAGVTECLRGAMAVPGITCISCHGNMFAVGDDSREPWADEPKCQSCHTGDAVDNAGAIRFKRTWIDNANSGTLRPAPQSRFAENPNTLFRNSLGHGGVACASCHGSPHGEWPSREANDNLAPEKLQDHKGTIIECSTCHGSTLPATLRGPHGMHNVNAPVWIDEDGHGHAYERNENACKACHGTNLLGTVLSKTPVKRVFAVDDDGDDARRTVTVKAGATIGCTLCHEKP